MKKDLDKILNEAEMLQVIHGPQRQRPPCVYKISRRDATDRKLVAEYTFTWIVAIRRAIEWAKGSSTDRGRNALVFRCSLFPHDEFTLDDGTLTYFC